MPSKTDTNRPAASRRGFLKAASGLMLGTSLGFGFKPVQAQTKPLRWGSATLGASGYIIIEALASTVNRHSDLRGSSVSTGGSTENMALLGAREIDLGQTTSWEWQLAKNAEAPFKQKIEPVQMLSYAIWSLHPLVRADSGLRRLEDLAGKRVSPGPIGGVTAHLWKLMFQKAGLYDKVRWTNGSWRETYDGFKSGAIDCIGSIMVAGKPSAIVIELESTHKIRPLAIDRGLMAEVSKANPGALIYTITPDMWKSLDAPLDTPAASGILAARPELGGEAGYKIVKAIYDNEADVRKIAAELDMIRIDLGAKFLMTGYPVNPGAARYFKERGVWRDELVVQA